MMDGHQAMASTAAATPAAMSCPQCTGIMAENTYLANTLANRVQPALHAVSLQRDALLHETNTLRTENDTLKHHNAQLRGENDALQRENQHLEETVSTAQEALMHTNEALIETNYDLDQSRARQDTVSSRVDKSVINIARAWQEEEKELKKQIDALQQRVHQVETSSSAATATALRLRIQELEATIRALQRDRDEEVQRAHALQMERSGALDSYWAALDRNAALQQRIDELDAVLAASSSAHGMLRESQRPRAFLPGYDHGAAQNNNVAASRRRVQSSTSSSSSSSSSFSAVAAVRGDHIAAHNVGDNSTLAVPDTAAKMMGATTERKEGKHIVCHALSEANLRSALEFERILAGMRRMTDRMVEDRRVLKTSSVRDYAAIGTTNSATKHPPRQNNFMRVPTASSLAIVLTGFGAFGSICDNPTIPCVKALTKSLPSIPGVRVVSSTILPVSAAQCNAWIDSTAAHAADTAEQQNSRMFDRSKLEVSSDSAAAGPRVLCNQRAGSASRERIMFLHLGVHAGSREVRVETRARNEATFRVPDTDGYAPQGMAIDGSHGTSNVLCTAVDVHALVDHVVGQGRNVAVSDNAGSYVCNYLYYQSLRRLASAGGGSSPAFGDSLFVHIPPFQVMPMESTVAVLYDIVLWCVSQP